MGVVHILSGVPGSGKSYLARQLQKSFDEENPKSATRHRVSADDFFEDPITGYAFNPAEIAKAHAICLKRFIQLLRCGDDEVVVDNTNIYAWERCNYVEVAEALGYAIRYHFLIVDTIADLNLCIRRNVHGVPPLTIARMAMEHEIMPETAVTGIVNHYKIKAQR